jgi:exosortase A-associated hydrolase 1/exosortase A-associated hydrolase 2
MNRPTPHTARPFVLHADSGPLHATYYAPSGAPHPAGDILVVPAFAEEMNRCRAMVALQARQLAQRGMGTLVLDPYGTGDSAGDFVDADWTVWKADLQTGIDWLRQHGQGCSSLWGLRLGALMATQLAHEDAQIRRLLLWQPVLNGKTFYTQFLRIRIAAELNLPDRVKSTNELRERTARGESIEVSGYRIGPRLAQQLDDAVVDDSAFSRVETHWFEVLQSAESVVAPAALQTIERLRGTGAAVQLGTPIGPAFWHVHERELAPALLNDTSLSVQTWSGSGTPSPAAPTTQPAATIAADLAEQPLMFPCDADSLSGVLHLGAAGATRGVIIVVAGGPQYRAGAHRQFVSLARRVAKDGFPVLRFDLRGMGDSEGEHRGYKQSDPDIRAAVDALLARQPQLKDVVLLGECESASGILFYAWRDPRVSGTVLINPWVRTEEGRAQTIVRHYYLGRLMSGEFWKHVFSGKYKARESITSMLGVVSSAIRGRIQMARQTTKPELDDISGLPLPVRTAEGLRRFKGRSLLLMSGVDLIAREFDEVTSASRAWDGLLASPQLRRVDIEGADHTFSREVWKTAAADTVAQWLAQA